MNEIKAALTNGIILILASFFPENKELQKAAKEVRELKKLQKQWSQLGRLNDNLIERLEKKERSLSFLR